MTTCNFIILKYPYLCSTAYVSDGSTTDYAFAWSYLGIEDWSGEKSRYIRVWLNGVETTQWTMTEAQEIRLTSAPAVNTCILIRRDSDPTDRQQSFVSGSRNTARAQEFDSKKMFFLIQELYDQQVDGQNVYGGDGMFNTYTFTGDSSTTTFALENDDTSESNISNEAEVMVSLNGALQQITSYDLDDNTGGVTEIIFDSAPSTGVSIEVRTMTSGIAQPLGNIPDGSVSGDKLADCAIDETNWNRIVCIDDLATLEKSVMIWDEGTGGLTLTQRPLEGADISDLQDVIDATPISDLADPEANVSMNAHKITNLADGVDDTDAVNKGQLDEAIDAINDGGIVPRVHSGITDIVGYDAITVTTGDPAFDWDTLIFTVNGLDWMLTNNGDPATLETPRTYQQLSIDGDSPITYTPKMGQSFGGFYNYRFTLQRINNGFQVRNIGNFNVGEMRWTAYKYT